MGTLALLERILGVVSSLLGLTPLLELLGFGLDKAAHEHVEYAIEGSAVATSLAVANPTYGLSAIHADVAAAQAAIIAALDGLVVTLPVEPPAWYTSPPSGGDTALAVWGAYIVEGEAYTAGQHLIYLEAFASNIGRAAAFVLQNDPFLVVEASWKYPPD
jgi:hypothetical protein